MLAGTTEEHTDLLVIGVLVLAVLLLTSPTMIVGLIVAMCTGRGGPSSAKLDRYQSASRNNRPPVPLLLPAEVEMRKGTVEPIRRHRNSIDTRPCD